MNRRLLSVLARDVTRVPRTTIDRLYSAAKRFKKFFLSFDERLVPRITLAGEVPTGYVERRNSNLEKRKRSNFGKTKRISTYVSLTPTASGSPAKNSLEKIPCRCQRSKLLPSSGLFPIITEATTATIRRANERIAFSDRCV